MIFIHNKSYITSNQQISLRYWQKKRKAIGQSQLKVFKQFIKNKNVKSVLVDLTTSAPFFVIISGKVMLIK